MFCKDDHINHNQINLESQKTHPYIYNQVQNPFYDLVLYKPNNFMKIGCKFHNEKNISNSLVGLQSRNILQNRYKSVHSTTYSTPYRSDSFPPIPDSSHTEICTNDSPSRCFSRNIPTYNYSKKNFYIKFCKKKKNRQINQSKITYKKAHHPIFYTNPDIPYNLSSTRYKKHISNHTIYN